ncbi:MAG: protein kinase [Planctomycetes bacterium]|nr:protein kinase [Planctomycetota bacterium]
MPAPTRTRTSAQLRAQLTRTIRSGVVEGVSDDEASQPELPQPILERRALGTEGARFEVRDLLGAGASGQVYAVYDRDLRRTVAVKFMAGAEVPAPDRFADFLDEAQITAALQHPNIPPIHEVDVDARGRLFFMMKRIEGHSLGHELAEAAGGQRSLRIASTNAVVGIAIGAGNALAFAHHHGIAHQDVKPDNLMLGDFGEILLADWGSAVRVGTGRVQLYGTPLYMSPEQARLEPVDLRSDIYGLGATLFHALLLRPPMWAEDEEDFWRRKRAGLLDEPTPAERARVPAALLAIAMRAMQPRAQDRYHTVELMVDDLQRFQGGLAVRAHRETFSARLRRIVRRHGRAIAIGTTVAVVILGLLDVIYGERLKEVATWGHPVLVEDFATEAWRTRWKVQEGAFEVREGWLVSTASLGSRMSLQRQLSGDTAVEFEGEIMPGTAPCDLSLIWQHDPIWAADGSKAPDPVSGLFKLQVGAYNGSFTGILDTHEHILAFNGFRPQVGTRYHLRFEKVGARIAILVDGRELCHYIDPLPFTSGYIALYAWYRGKAFRDVRVYALGIPEKVPATAIGDALLQDRLYEQAAQQYRRVRDGHPGSAIAEEARYKEGLSLLRKGDAAAAAACWAPLAGTAHEELVEIERIDQLGGGGDQQALCAAIRSRYPRASPEGRAYIAMQWARHADALDETAVAASGELFQGLHDDLLASEVGTERAAANLLLRRERFDELLRLYPHQDVPVCEALECLGRYEQILARFPHMVSACEGALFNLGRSREMDASVYNADDLPSSIWDGMIAQGRVDEVLLRAPTYPPALLVAGRFDQALAAARDQATPLMAMTLSGRSAESADAGQQHSVEVLMATGQDQEAYDRYHDDRFVRMWPRHLLGLEAFKRGDLVRAWQLFATGERPLSMEHPMSAWLVPYRDYGFDLHHFLILPFLHELAGEDGAVMRACTDVARTLRWPWQQKPWHRAEWLLGRLTDAQFLAQPHRVFAMADLTLCKAIAAERMHDRQAAIAAWKTWLASSGSGARLTA